MTPHHLKPDYSIFFLPGNHDPKKKVVLYREFEKWLLLGPTRMAKWSVGCLQQKESSVREEERGDKNPSVYCPT